MCRCGSTTSLMTSSNGTFSALLALCAGNSSVTGEFPSQRPVTRSFGFFFDLSWTNGWANSRDASDLRRHRAHYHVTIMVFLSVRLNQHHRWYQNERHRPLQGESTGNIYISMVDFPHKWSVTRKGFPYTGIIFHCCHIFPWLCVWGGCTIEFCQWLYIDHWKAGVLFSLPALSQSMMCANNLEQHRAKVVLFCFHITLSHYHHHVELYENIEYMDQLSGI